MGPPRARRPGGTRPAHRRTAGAPVGSTAAADAPRVPGPPPPATASDGAAGAPPVGGPRSRPPRTGGGAPRPGAPGTLTASAAATGVEAVVLLLFVLLRVVLVLTGGLGNVGPVVATAVVLGLLALGLGVAARALVRGRRGGRAPALVGHLLTLGVAGTIPPVGAVGVGAKLLLAAVAVAGAVTLLLPATTRALGTGRGRPVSGRLSGPVSGEPVSGEAVSGEPTPPGPPGRPARRH